MMSLKHSLAPVCISILFVISNGLAQLTPVITGVLDEFPLTCDEEVPEPDYANVLIDPQCSSVTLTAADRRLCQDYRIYEVQTPIYNEEIPIENYGLWLSSTSNISSPQFYWQSDRSRLFVSDQDAFLLAYANYSLNPDIVFEVYLELINGSDYTEWTNQYTVGNPQVNRTYRDGIGVATALGGDLWTTWSYYETDGESSFITGENQFLGSSGSIDHAPSNLLFGFQLGEAASGHNANYGFTVWGQINGWHNGEGWSAQCDIDGDAVLIGTVGELYCDDVILRTWTATDNCGLVSRKSQMILTEGGFYPSDFNGNGTTDILDFTNFNSVFGSNCFDCPEDLNDDGVVDIQDFLLWNSLFSSLCE